MGKIIGSGSRVTGYTARRGEEARAFDLHVARVLRYNDADYLVGYATNGNGNTSLTAFRADRILLTGLKVSKGKPAELPAETYVCRPGAIFNFVMDLGDKPVLKQEAEMLGFRPITDHESVDAIELAPAPARAF